MKNEKVRRIKKKESTKDIDSRSNSAPVKKGKRNIGATKKIVKREKGESNERSYLIQELLFPFEDAPTELYFFIFDDRDTSLNTENFLFEESIVLKENYWLSTNCYFNSLYGAYWRKFTTINRVFLEFTVLGNLIVNVFENTISGTKNIYSHSVDAKERVSVRIPIFRKSAGLFPSSKPGRVFFDLRAVTQCTVSDIRYTTDVPPERDVALSIGLCTFNREEELAITLSQLKTLALSEPAIVDVIVVNQGSDLSGPVIRETLVSPPFRTFTQSNLGGCGGFTRSFVEVLDAGLATHHLVMDDDIIFDARIVLRSLIFLRYTRQEIALGGAMLNSFLPHEMYEAGAFIRNDASVEIFSHNLDLTFPASCNAFSRVVPTDYNGWWYCILPLGPLRKIGLPTPIFIRGDDIETAQRLADAGVKTVTLPGLAVWHEPFYVKPPGWQIYYDIRNRLIFAARFPEKVTTSLTLMVLEAMMTPLLTHDYSRCRLVLRAIADYLSGPDLLFGDDPDAVHRDISLLAKKAGPISVNSDFSKDLPRPRRLKARPSSVSEHFLSYIPRGIALAVAPHRRKACTLLMEAQVHPSQVGTSGYVKTNGPGTYHLQYTPDRWQYLGLLLNSTRHLLVFMAKRGKAAGLWRSRTEKYQSRDHWKSLFAANLNTSSASPTKETQK